MTWQKEFPTYTNMPPIPKNWSDQSWGADVCPSFEVQKGSHGAYTVWVDFEFDSQREHPGTCRFSVNNLVSTIEDPTTFLETDSWDEVLQFLGEKT